MSDEPLWDRTEHRHSGNFEARAFAIEGPLLVAARRFGDARGYFAETFRA